MSKQIDQEKQAVVEVSNEQLAEIAGGYLPTREQVVNAAQNVMTTTICCGMGALIGHTLGDKSMKATLVGAGFGLRTGLELAKRGYHLHNLHSLAQEHLSVHQPLLGDLEAGTAHEQH
jgi:hypothetical protein